MNNDDLNKLIYKWILSLIENHPDLSLISPQFNFDNGLFLEESILYEQKQYLSFSEKYDLDTNFSIAINNIIIQNNKYHIYYTVINSKKIPIFKWYVTLENIENSLFIGSNNYLSQIVHKYNIQLDEKNEPIISGFNLAIKVEQNYSLTSIINNHLELKTFTSPSSFTNDGFQFASFFIKDIDSQENNHAKFNELKFKLLYLKNGKQIIENRVVPFNLSLPIPPFHIENNVLYIQNNKYPFHLYMEDINHNITNILHPRSLIIPLNKDITSLVITDCLDNDWNIKTKLNEDMR